MDGMDMLQGVKDAVNEESAPIIPPPGDDFEMPSLEKLLEALETMEMPAEEKEKLKEVLQQRSNIGNMMDDLIKPGIEIIPTSNPLMFYTLLLAFIVMIVLFVFFGYKLYRSLTEKERKKKEKLKQKQMKKKK